MANKTYKTPGIPVRAASGVGFAGSGVRMTAMAAMLSMLSLTAVHAAGAQERGRAAERGRGMQDRGRDSQEIPPGHLPPPGECRVWYDNRPAGQQSPPTSCDNARAVVARAGGRVIYGDAARKKDRGRDDRGRDDRRRDKECDEKDRRKGECGTDHRDDDHYPDRGRDGDRIPDRDGDRYPDRTYPRTLPEMVWGVIFGRGERQNEVRQWVGGEPVRATFTDADHNGTPEAVTWTDSAGRIVQRWIDVNHDGRADRVAFYQNGKIVRVIP